MFIVTTFGLGRGVVLSTVVLRSVVLGSVGGRAVVVVFRPCSPATSPPPSSSSSPRRAGVARRGAVVVRSGAAVVGRCGGADGADFH